MSNHRTNLLHIYSIRGQQNKMIFSSREDINNLKHQDNVALKPNNTYLSGGKVNRRKLGLNLIRDIDWMDQF